MLGFLKRLFGRKSSPDPVALVILEETPRILSVGHVAQAVSRAVGRSFPESQVAEERPSYHRLTVDGFELTVASAPFPYLPKESAPHPEMRLQDAIDRHEGAVLVDCWAAPEGRDRKEATGMMGRMVAELVDDASLAVFCFHTQRLNLVDETLLSMFRDGRALEAMETITFEPIAGVESGDARMQAAIAEARDRWPEFAAAFSAKPVGDDRPFILKAPFGEGDHCEHMWVQVEAITSEKATGVLLNDPLYRHGLKKGSRVDVAVQEITDWAYPEGEAFAGMFSEAIVRGG
ncbi:DUF2314 domain-containing protein [bacterium]|nr:MAG: DUF2314 domain-containing protein [bacterium]